MAILDTIYRVFMFLLPYSVCFAGYVWMGRKAWHVPQKAAKFIALFVIAAGLCFTLYRLVRSLSSFFTNDNFEFIIIIVAVAVLALASIVMAIGEPEEENNRTNKQGMMNEEGREKSL